MQLTDLTVEDLGGGRILVGLDPLLALAQVVGNTGMNHRVILTVDGRNAVFLHDGHGLCNTVGSEQTHNLSGSLHGGRTGGSTSHSAGGDGDVVAVQHIGVDQQCITDQSLLGLRSGSTHFLGSAQDHIIIGAQFQLVSDGSVGTVLVDSAGLGTHTEFLTGGDNTFLQHTGLGKGVPLTPFHGSTAVGGQVLLLCKLCVEHLHAGVFQQLGIVEGFQLPGKGVGAVECLSIAVIGVDIVAGSVDHSTGFSKQLQVHGNSHQMINKLFHNYFSFRKMMVSEGENSAVTLDRDKFSPRSEYGPSAPCAVRDSCSYNRM